jgi:hypothetical protein
VLAFLLLVSYAPCHRCGHAVRVLCCDADAVEVMVVVSTTMERVGVDGAGAQTEQLSSRAGACDSFKTGNFSRNRCCVDMLSA